MRKAERQTLIPVETLWELKILYLEALILQQKNHTEPKNHKQKLSGFTLKITCTSLEKKPWHMGRKIFLHQLKRRGLSINNCIF